MNHTVTHMKKLHPQAGKSATYPTITSSLIIAATLTLSACMPANHGPVETHTHVTTAPVPTASVIPAAPEPTHAPVPVATAPIEQYVVQLTASKSRQKAQNIKDQFAADGYNAFVSPLNLNGKLLHRVQIGMFNDQADAKMVLAQMQVKYPRDPYVAAAITKTP